MNAKPCVQVRAIQSAEASKAVDFIDRNSTENPGYSFCLHHADSIFVAIDEADEWKGLAVTYKAPSLVGTAIIDRLLGENDIIEILMEYVDSYYRQLCIFRLRAIPQERSLFGDYLKSGGWKWNEGGFYSKQLLPDRICLNNRKMRPKMNTINGEISEDTLFEYYQKDDLVWGTYAGGTVERGVLVGRMTRNGDINFHYVQINNQQEINTGTSYASTEFMNDGRIILYEDWQWTGNKSGGGRSVIEEVRE